MSSSEKESGLQNLIQSQWGALSIENRRLFLGRTTLRVLPTLVDFLIKLERGEDAIGPWEEPSGAVFQLAEVGLQLTEFHGDRLIRGDATSVAMSTFYANIPTSASADIAYATATATAKAVGATSAKDAIEIARDTAAAAARSLGWKRTEIEEIIRNDLTKILQLSNAKAYKEPLIDLNDIGLRKFDQWLSISDRFFDWCERNQLASLVQIYDAALYGRLSRRDVIAFLEHRPLPSVISLPSLPLLLHRDVFAGSAELDILSRLTDRIDSVLPLAEEELSLSPNPLWQAWYTARRKESKPRGEAWLR